jgi:hypothetical protein
MPEPVEEIREMGIVGRGATATNGGRDGKRVARLTRDGTNQRAVIRVTSIETSSASVVSADAIRVSPFPMRQLPAKTTITHHDRTMPKSIAETKAVEDEVHFRKYHRGMAERIDNRTEKQAIPLDLNSGGLSRDSPHTHKIIIAPPAASSSHRIRVTRRIELVIPLILSFSLLAPNRSMTGPTNVAFGPAPRAVGSREEANVTYSRRQFRISLRRLTAPSSSPSALRPCGGRCREG